MLLYGYGAAAILWLSCATMDPQHLWMEMEQRLIMAPWGTSVMSTVQTFALDMI